MDSGLPLEDSRFRGKGLGSRVDGCSDDADMATDVWMAPGAPCEQQEAVNEQRRTAARPVRRQR
eukprot:3851099-Rhodomonas_salina.2